MTKQPVALRLADILDEPDLHYPGNFNTPKRANALLMGLAQEAADELRRLERINAQLLEALEDYEPNNAHKAIAAARGQHDFRNRYS